MEKQILKSKIIMELEKKIQQANNNAVEAFWYELEHKGTPLIEKIDGDPENDLVTFVYKVDEEIENVLLISPIGWLNLQECKMERLFETNVWYITYKIRNDIRLFYYFSVNDSFDNDWEQRFKKSSHDVFNKNVTVHKGDNEDDNKLRSYALMSKAEEHVWVNEQKDISKGILHEHKFHSEKLEKSRRIRIYTPYGYKEDNKPYGFLVLTDGDDYINMLSAVTVVDNLIADKKIPPIVTIFIDSTETRREELTCNDNFGDIIVKEIVPWARDNYNISSSACKYIIGGLSLGGLTAAYLGLKHSEVFGNILSQSGSYWYDPEGYKGECWLGKQYEIIDKLPLRFYLNVGALEHKEQMIATNKNLRDILIAKGYTVDFEEFKSGHDYLCWGETLANGLISLIGMN
jgi:enterochelin esterase-like enzyme